MRLKAKPVARSLAVFAAPESREFSRNLTTAEIVGQIQAARALPRDESAPPISNVVFMGMGEPLLNLAALAPALSIITAADGLAFAPRPRDGFRPPESRPRSSA